MCVGVSWCVGMLIACVGMMGGLSVLCRSLDGLCGVVEFSQCAAQCVVMRMCDVVDVCCFCYSYGCVIRVCMYI